MEHVAIIGNGIAGITAARHIRKNSDFQITVISGETDYFFSRTALMYIYMGHMKFEHTKPYEDWFWEKNRIDLKKGWVKEIDFDNKKLHLGDERISYDKLILALGSQSNMFGWPGQDLDGVQGLISYQDLELLEKNTQDIENAVILGGGLIGVEMAEMLHSRGIHITYLIREDHFWGNILPKEESSLIDNHLYEHGIDLRQNTELEEIIGDENGKVRGIRTKSSDTIECQFVGITVGVHPNIDLIKNTKLETDRGILVDEYLQTNIPDVFAIGDCAQLRNPPTGRRSIEAVWYVGRMMGETVGHTISGNKTEYKPGIWFNSAKFFDIEYQNYGIVLPDCPADDAEFYWECHDRKKAIKVVYGKDSFKVKGINLFGLRQRHEVWNKWLEEGRTLDYVIGNLEEAHFDPEFFIRYEASIQEKFNMEFPDKEVSKRKRTLFKKLIAS